ncbi:MAG: hypothetical protein LUH54_04590, partial [Firmicutes bacterium]|nr:hypothetical protein [Bacillota bacterium]
FISMLLALSLIFCMTALTACGGDDEGEDTNTSAADGTTTAGAEDSTEAGTDEGTETEEGTEAGTETEEVTTADATDEANTVAYDWSTINDGFEPASCYFDWGAPDDESHYFVIDADHVIHDGKGSWSDVESTSACYVFDGGSDGMDTFYDCDEGLSSADHPNSLAFGGIVLYDQGLGEDWIAGDADGDGAKDTDEDGNEIYTGYVGAYIESGVVIHQLRYYPRSNMTARMVNGYFEASVDGETWVTLYTVEEEPSVADFTFVDIDDATVYYYVRYVSPDEGYCNIAELEIWGVSGS